MNNRHNYIAELKNAFESQQGKLITDFLQNKLIEHSNSNISSDCLKGMGILIWDLKDIKTQFNELKKSNL